MPDMIIPNWQVPNNVKAYTTTRKGGVSIAPYDSFNLADHVDDNPEHVKINRQLLKTNLHLPNEPIWLKQVHSTTSVIANQENTGQCADAVYSYEKNTVCVVMTADCLPVLLTNQQGNMVAAIHAGWRGLAGGILETTLQQLNVISEDVIVWLGPAISGKAFEVGDEVRTAFIDFLPQAEHAFIPTRAGHWLADLYLLAKQRLNQQGITQIYGGEFCTYTDESRFYSYRRDKQTGRMASLIWLT